jgi:uncharacterized protein YprB with RNaseH-like and TPR domain
MRKGSAVSLPAEGPQAEAARAAGKGAAERGGLARALGPEWSSAGALSVVRGIPARPSPVIPGELPGALHILLPDLIPYSRDRGPPDLFDLRFFDLETTGISGGAGTVAFLAAFGRFVPEKGPPDARSGSAAPLASAPGSVARLQVRQYLLLDYPGEGEFLEAVLAELQAPAPSGRPPLLVTYNGKTFDTQILKIRCLMNGLKPPEYYHADLLHPCRRLWKRVLSHCSQGEIETAVLGLDRSGDLPGALAPEQWFSFLKNGETGGLLRVCDHNLRDIRGLAAIFAALTRIAEDPAAAETYRVDLESLALRWFYACRREPPAENAGGRAGTAAAAERRRAEELLALAAERACPRAAFLWAGELFRRGRAEEGRVLLRSLTEAPYPEEAKAAAYRALAVDAEWRLKDPALALWYTEYFLSQKHLRARIKQDIMKRRERLRNKLDLDRRPE